MSLSFNATTGPGTIGDVAFWFDYFNSTTTVGNTAGGNHFRSIVDTSANAYDMQTSTATEEFENEGTGFQVNEGSNMGCTNETANEFAFLHQSDNTVVMRVKHASFSAGTGNTIYYGTGRGNEQSVQMNYELLNERRRLYLFEGGAGTTNVERPYQDNKYPVDIQAGTYFNLFVVIDHTNDMLRLLNNGIETVSFTIGAPSVNDPRFPLRVGGTDIGTSQNTYVWSQLIAFNKVLTDTQILQLNSFLNAYTG